MKPRVIIPKVRMGFHAEGSACGKKDSVIRAMNVAEEKARDTDKEKIN